MAPRVNIFSRCRVRIPENKHFWPQTLCQDPATFKPAGLCTFPTKQIQREQQVILTWKVEGDDQEDRSGAVEQAIALGFGHVVL